MIARRLRVPTLLLVVAGLTAAGLLVYFGPSRVVRALRGGRANKLARRAASPKVGEEKPVPIFLGDAAWPQFLGPHRNNVSTETGLLESWAEGGPKLITTLRGLGTGFANVAIADNTVYTMGNRDEREYILALALDTGKEVWEFDNAPAFHNNFGDGPRCTPTLDHEWLYALGSTGELTCLDRKTGKKIWRKNLVKDFSAAIPRWGFSESPLIEGDHVICTPGGPEATMVALDKKTGDVVWKGAVPQKDGPAYASAIAIEAGGVRQFVNFTASAVIGVRASDGLVLWRDDSSANATANCCAPVALDNLVLTASGYGKGASALTLSSSAGRTTAELAYHSNNLKVKHAGLVLLDGYVYGSNESGILTCVDFKSGQVKWSDRSVGQGSLTCAEGRLILRSEDGPTALILASPDSYIELGRFQPAENTSSRAWAYPVICGGKLFLRDQDILQVYDVQGK
jgi:outer membrane protein assembly factor BamB